MRQLISVLLLLILVAAFAWPDAPLAPGVIEARARPPRLGAAVNAFYPMAALGVDPLLDAATEGYAAVSRVNALLADAVPLRDAQVEATIAAAWVQPQLQVRDERRLLCAPREPGCIGQWWRERVALRALARRHDVLLRRYRGLRHYPQYQNELLPHVLMPLTDHRLSSSSHRLLLAIHLLDYIEQEAAEPAALLEDIELQRRLLAQADDVLAKMMALSNLADSLHVYAALLDRAGPGGAAAFRPLPRLSEAEKSLRGALRFEFRLSTSMLPGPGTASGFEALGLPPWMPQFTLRPLFKPGRSLNLAWDCFEKNLAVAVLPATELRARWSQLPQRCEYAWYENLINVIGTLLLRLAQPEFSRYAVRLHDVDGLLVMVALKRALRIAGRGAEHIPTLLGSGLYLDPYTHSPVRWDVRKGVLSVQSPQPEQGLHILPLDALGRAAGDTSGSGGRQAKVEQIFERARL